MATRTAAPGLSTDELARIRDTLATGRKPKVVFTAAAGQIAGQVGQVVELTDPALSDEWVVVRFGHDELPFSPADLQLPARAKPSVRAAAQLPAPLPGPREEPFVPSSTSAPLNGAARPAKAAKASAAAAKPAAGDPPVKAVAPAKAPAQPVEKPAERPAEKPATKPAEAPVVAADAAPAPPAKAPARKAGKPKAPPSLTVTLTYAEGEWMVGATQGAKALAKPYVIKPSEALKMVSMLDVPGVHDAVDEIVSAARAEAERQAERLRAELAEVESKLAELREAG